MLNWKLRWKRRLSKTSEVMLKTVLHCIKCPTRTDNFGADGLCIGKRLLSVRQSESPRVMPAAVVLLGALTGLPFDFVQAATLNEVARYRFEPNAGQLKDWDILNTSHGSNGYMKVRDSILDRDVIQFNGTLRLDFTRPGLNVTTKQSGNLQPTPDERSTFSVKWTMRTNTSFKAVVLARTTRGLRKMIYFPASKTRAVDLSDSIVTTIDKRSTSAKWVRIQRNLVEDLQRVQPGNAIIGVESFQISGESLLANVFIEGVVNPAADAISNKLAAQSRIGGTENSAPSSATALPLLPHRRWSLHPYVVAARNARDRDNEIIDEISFAGITAKYDGNSIDAFVDIFPDFSLVEQRVNPIDFSYNEKELDDARPFFVTAKRYFGEDNDYFYSIRVPDFDLGVKTFLDYGSSRLGILYVDSPDDRQDLHAHLSHSYSKTSLFTLDTVASNQGDLEHRLAAISAKDKFRNNLFYDFKGAAATVLSPTEDSNGNSLSLEVGWNPGKWSVSYGSDFYALAYNPITGLLERDLPGTRGQFANLGFYSSGSKSIKELYTDVSINRRAILAGDTQNNGLNVTSGAEIFDQARLTLNYYNLTYRPVTDTLGVFTDSVNNDEYWSADVDLNIKNSVFGYGFSLADGLLAGAEYKYIAGYAWAAAAPGFSVNISAERLTSFGQFDQFSFGGKLKIDNRQAVNASYDQGDTFKQFQLAYQRRFGKAHEIFLSYQRLTGTKDELIGKYVWNIQ